jgi:two-component system sensor histidine kinase HydH
MRHATALESETAVCKAGCLISDNRVGSRTIVIGVQLCSDSVLESASKKSVLHRRPGRIAVLIGAIVVISLLHYSISPTHIWLEALLQRLYYIPLLLMAIWYGWRGGVLASALAALLYIPHIRREWASHPRSGATQEVAVVTFFAITVLTGILADHERAQRQKAEKLAQQLTDANAQLRASFEQLRRADRLSAMGELSAGLAHEIGNPLGGIKGAVRILGRPQLADETREKFSSLAERELERLSGIVEHFLEFARPREPRRLATNPMRLLESVAGLAGETAKMKGIQIKVAGNDRLPQISVDPEQIRQVLLNLVLNAIQAMLGGGEIVLRGIADDKEVHLAVEDQGIGIAPENIDRIFDPFFTTKQEGTGLGLSIAGRIIAQHGGQIEPRRNAGRGMTFSVILPRAESEPAHSISVEAL